MTESSTSSFSLIALKRSTVSMINLFVPFKRVILINSNYKGICPHKQAIPIYCI